MRKRAWAAKAKGFIVAVSLGLTAPVSAQADNLADALVGAYQTSDLLAQNRALLRAADEDAAIALSALRPVLDFVAGIARSSTETTALGVTTIDRTTSASSLALSASLLLYDNGQSRLRTQAARELVLATRASLLSVEQQVLLRAVSAYMNVLRAEEFVQLRQNNLRLLTEELRAAQDRFDVGEVTRTDVALAEAAQAAARSNLATAQGDLINAQQEYLTVVGREPGRLAPPPRLPARPASIDAGKAVAVRNHPDIIQAQHQVAAADLTVMAQEAGLGPTVRMVGEVSVTDSRNGVADTDSSSIGLNYTQRIYQGGGLAAGVRQAMAQRDSSRALLLNVQDVIAQGVSTAMVRFRVAQANIQATDRQIRAAEVAFRGVREEAALGARTTLDVLDAEQQLLDARAARIAAQAELYIAAYQILAAQGALTAENLGLGVQIYDPTAYYNQVKNAPAYLSEQGRQLDRVLKSLGKE
ncbi:TolC family outer membrane protein [Aestuariivita boseongensis]|uniref:TolC family outer membrane protein n=1 Tax=Aestuariivita boseongensis TaxID=1470562 RepID=UPI00068279B5|nr:TolC family outer membrane protein [Aestuariivita boseongensis]